MNKIQAENRIFSLRKKIIEANKSYFLENIEIIPEEVRDSMKRELISLEKDFPELITEDSPSQRV
jgi:DNA ligase (NAD+)